MNDFPIRKIIHVDMDAFYASVEQMDDPSLRGKPVAVGGSRERGVVAAASYEARQFGVRSAMPSSIAAKRCSDLIFVKPRFERYKEISAKIRSIFYDYTDLVEPLSLDEAYLDVTDNKIDHPSATLLAREIRYRIFEEIGLTASAGISVNKFTAKIASDINKPNGQRTIPPEEVLTFLEDLPINKFFGVGKVTAEKMKFHGIFTGKDLKQKSLEYLSQHFGKAGKHFYDIVRGIQHSEVKPDRERKSVGAERTFSMDLRDSEYISSELKHLSHEIWKRLGKAELKGRTLTLKIKYQDFTQQTRSKTLDRWLNSEEEINSIAFSLLEKDELTDAVRLLGLSVSNLNNSDNSKGVAIQTEIKF